MWFNVITVVLVIFSVSEGRAEETECPFKAGPWQNEIDQAERLLGISITDLADGNIFEALNATTIVKKCKQKNNADIFKWLQIIGQHIKRCRYDDTKPRLDAFNIEGVKKAFEFMCKNETNLKVLEKNSACLEENMDEIAECHTGYMKKVAEEDILYQKCTVHRLHAYCAKKVLKVRCGKDIANMKEKAATLAFPPTCDCKFDSKRKTYTDVRDRDCMKDKDCWSHPTQGHLLESQIHNGVMFGARNMEMLEALCAKGEGQDAKAKVVEILGTCMDRGNLCTYPVQKYKLMLINFEGLKAAAAMMCDNFADFKKDQTCVEKEIKKAQDCVAAAVVKIKTDLTAAGKFNDMKEVVCQRQEKFKACAQEHFGKCSSKVSATINKMVAEREPRMCNCQKIGYGGNSGSAIRSSSLFTVFVILFSMFLKKFAL